MKSMGYGTLKYAVLAPMNPDTAPISARGEGHGRAVPQGTGAETVTMDLAEKHLLHRGYALEFETEMEWVRGNLPDTSTSIADETHVHIFDAEDLRSLLFDAGFTIVDPRSVDLPWFRHYQRFPSGWAMRRPVTRRARCLSALGHYRCEGQTLCCAAGRPISL